MSRTKAELLEELQHKLQVPPRLPGSAAELGYEVFLLSKELQSCNDPDGARLTRTYHEYVTNHKCFGMVQNQIEYAIRLASDQGDLLYEEMSKLFSLRDEIEALKTLGYVGDREGSSDVSKLSAIGFKERKGRRNWSPRIEQISGIGDGGGTLRMFLPSNPSKKADPSRSRHEFKTGRNYVRQPSERSLNDEVDPECNGRRSLDGDLAPRPRETPNSQHLYGEWRTREIRRKNRPFR
jgi:hypothetical protein